MATIREVVPCNGCTACCRRQAVILFPDAGDDVASYQTVSATNPLDGMPCHMLASKPNGECVYLGERGCTIYGRAPAMCRAFDCRRFYLKFDHTERRKGIAAGVLDRDIMAAGKARLASLPAEARTA